jgi:hypothetical protein
MRFAYMSLLHVANQRRFGRIHDCHQVVTENAIKILNVHRWKHFLQWLAFGYCLLQYCVGLYIIQTDKIHVVLRHVKQGVFVLLSVVYMHPFKWMQCVCCRKVGFRLDLMSVFEHNINFTRFNNISINRQ